MQCGIRIRPGLVFLTGVLAAFTLVPTAFAASLSCSAVGLSGEVCDAFNGKFDAFAELTVDRGTRIATTSAAVNSSQGSLRALASLSDAAGGAPGGEILTAGANLFATFTLLGPNPNTPIPLTALFNVHGTVVQDCGSNLCSAAISYTVSFSGSKGASSFSSTFGAGRSTGQPEWTINLQAPSATSAIAVTDPTGDLVSSGMVFMVTPGFDFKIDLSLSAKAEFHPQAPDGAHAIADAGNTALFNFLLPAGYSLATTTGFLSNPLLVQLPVPLPASLLLASSGLAALGVRVRRKRG